MRKSWRAWACVAFSVTVVVAMAACADESDTTPGATRPDAAPVPAPVQRDVGASGGTVINDEGTGVDIPPGAVPGNVAISVTPAPQEAPPPTAMPVGTPYVFGPSGLRFAVPVTVTLAFDPARLPAGATAADIAVFTAPDGTSRYERLKTRLKDATHVTAEAIHFSVFVATVETGGVCTPISCPPNTCGAQDDGCGGTLDCGTCAVPTQDSGAGGATCVAPACDPGACGFMPNPCGGTVACGGACDGGPPIPGACVAPACDPGACGFMPNPCGGTVACGGGCDGGPPSSGTCVAPACDTATCGKMPNPCGGTVTCSFGCDGG